MIREAPELSGAISLLILIIDHKENGGRRLRREKYNVIINETKNSVNKLHRWEKIKNIVVWRAKNPKPK